MPRRLAAPTLLAHCAITWATGLATFALLPTSASAEAMGELTATSYLPAEREVGVELGLVAGGGATVGGPRATGRFLYRLADRDWFEGSALFTFGQSDAACFVDRNGERYCDHGATAGAGAELSFGVRRYFPRGKFLPYARAALGVGISRFSDDEITGLVTPLHLGGGMRIHVAPRLGLVAQAEVAPGLGIFGRDVGVAPQFSFGVSFGVEFGLP